MQEAIMCDKFETYKIMIPVINKTVVSVEMKQKQKQISFQQSHTFVLMDKHLTLLKRRLNVVTNNKERGDNHFIKNRLTLLYDL